MPDPPRSAATPPVTPAAASVRSADGGAAAPERARYMYAVSRGLDRHALDAVRGIDDEPLEFVEHQDLVAVVSTVPLTSFGEEALHRNLEDLTWLESVVRSHDAVIQAAATRAPTAPLRLATICFDDDAVRARLREWYVSLTHVLDRVEGCSEWSVKVLALPPVPEPRGAADDEPMSGADYLRRKRAETTERSDADSIAAEAAHSIHDDLSRLSRASRQLPAQDPRLSGHHGTMVLNAAYLVSDKDADAFADRIAELDAEHTGLVVAGRGPWPPYSFATLEQR